MVADIECAPIRVEGVRAIDEAEADEGGGSVGVEDGGAIMLISGTECEDEKETSLK